MKKHALSNIRDLADGQMKSFEFGEHHVLIIKQDNRYYATGAHCTHYHAPLEEGLLHGDRLVCPWHHACFNIKTGQVDEPPAFDNLPVYEISEENGEYYVHLPDQPQSGINPLKNDLPDQLKDEKYVVIGGGAAAFYAVQTLRENGFEGRIIMINRENKVPYDRPNLSKDYLAGELPPEWMSLRSEEFYSKHKVELLFGQEAEQIDVENQEILIRQQKPVRYDKLLIASGGIPRQLDVPGNNMDGVLTLRSYHDADHIIGKISEEAKVTVIGTGFIGMEASLSLASRGAKVTVITPHEVPFSSVLGDKIGAIFMQQHKENGVEFITGRKVTGFRGDQRVAEVEMDDGTTVGTDLALVAIGIIPATGFARNLPKHEDGSLLVDEYFNCKGNIFAAGDVAAFPDPWQDGKIIRIEHWRTAQQQGRNAAHNMMGKKLPYRSVPFFWTKQGDLSLGYVGHAPQWDEIIYDGDPASKEFIAYFIKNNKMIAAAANYRDRELEALEEMLRINKLPTPEQLRKPGFNALEFLQ